MKKKQEVASFIDHQLNQRGIKYFDYKLIVQHFCLETWGLGNPKIIARSNKSAELKKYTKHYNVTSMDPELLTSFSGESLTRAQHAEKYLRTALLSKHKNLTYTKGNPAVLANNKYFIELKKRLDKTGHIKSFQDFLDAFK